MRKIAPLTLAGAVLVGLSAWALVAGGGGARTTAPVGKEPSPAGTAHAGFVVHIDPSTGAFTEASERTVPVTLDDEVQNALSTSSEGLVEVPHPTAGGAMVDLRGRFQNAVIAAVDEAGGVRATCVSALPGEVPSGGDTDACADSTRQGGERR